MIGETFEACRLMYFRRKLTWVETCFNGTYSFGDVVLGIFYFILKGHHLGSRHKHFDATWAEIIGIVWKSWWSAENSVWCAVHFPAVIGLAPKSVQHIMVWCWSPLAPIGKAKNTMKRSTLSGGTPIGAHTMFLQVGECDTPFLALHHFFHTKSKMVAL